MIFPPFVTMIKCLLSKQCWFILYVRKGIKWRKKWAVIALHKFGTYFYFKIYFRVVTDYDFLDKRGEGVGIFLIFVWNWGKWVWTLILADMIWNGPQLLNKRITYKMNQWNNWSMMKVFIEHPFYTRSVKYWYSYSGMLMYVNVPNRIQIVAI